MINGIVFDMDGIMFDTERLSTDGWLDTAKKLNIDLPIEFIDSFKGTAASFSEKLFKQRFGKDFDYEYARKLRTEYMESVIEESGVPVKAGLMELLDYLKPRQIPAAIATSTRRELAEKYLTMTGIYDYFDAIIYGDTVENSKPAPDIFLKAIQMLGKKAEECIVLEDSPNGIQAGYSAGIRVVHIPDQIMITDEMKKNVYKICNNLNEVIQVIEYDG